ncbi:uncharacterized protein LTR77_010957 [Saxophila tyrrhenica]|uniref:Glycoside hydrolase family 31 protein n=1 Tax=Saxophila tyrrhenica TaxID=1690608 RepID=A0AAV9NY56_9PEZI|nr:hypothetical protein LTR77_010957 [Saxophila tyrrhenica]
MRLSLLQLAASASTLAHTRGQPVEVDGRHGGPSSHAASISVSSTSPFGLTFSNGVVSAENTAILVGETNRSATPISASNDGSIGDSTGHISFSAVNSQVAKITINTTSSFVGARFTTSESDHFYGIWEYPFKNRQLTNDGVNFEIKGVENVRGVNYANARSPFFITNAGYGVYTDTLEMGTYNFEQSGVAEFNFNSSSLVYYIILPKETDDYKSIITAYSELSNTIYMPPDSAYGPIYWSDDWEQDLHGLNNSQESYYDTITHLYDYQIHGTAMFADRPYGTGNYSYGNFDFDPEFYPTPGQFIANLSNWGFDFQVWAANRAFLYTELYNVSVANGWLFPGIDPEFFLGPALNLSIPEAYDYFKQHLSYYPSVGVKGYKIDRGEEGELPVYEQNTQIALFEQLCWETMEEKWGEGNFYNFARNIVDRSRSRSAVWNGDAQSNWTGLAFSVTSGIRSGLIGFSQSEANAIASSTSSLTHHTGQWGSDTGGYLRDLDDPHQELWSRWMWFSTFSPMYEIPIGTNHTPWYPTETNPYTPELVQVLKESTDLHYELFPFIKSYTYQAHKTGLPAIRAAFLEAPQDPKTYTMGESYFFGAEFFIAPIITPGGRRSVYFPEGGKYLEYFNKTAVHEGGTTTDVEMDVHAIPAYVRAGSIVPRGQIFRGNDRWTANWMPYLDIEVFPSAEVPQSRFWYYNGDADEEVIIEMIMEGGKVVVQYGNVALNGTISAFLKGGKQTAEIHSGGGSVVFEECESLFE